MTDKKKTTATDLLDALRGRIEAFVETSEAATEAWCEVAGSGPTSAEISLAMHEKMAALNVRLSKNIDAIGDAASDGNLMGALATLVRTAGDVIETGSDVVGDFGPGVGEDLERVAAKEGEVVEALMAPIGEAVEYLLEASAVVVKASGGLTGAMHKNFVDYLDKLGEANAALLEGDLDAAAEALHEAKLEAMDLPEEPLSAVNDAYKAILPELIEGLGEVTREIGEGVYEVSFGDVDNLDGRDPAPTGGGDSGGSGGDDAGDPIVDRGDRPDGGEDAGGPSETGVLDDGAGNTDAPNPIEEEGTIDHPDGHPDAPPPPPGPVAIIIPGEPIIHGPEEGGGEESGGGGGADDAGDDSGSDDAGGADSGEAEITIDPEADFLIGSFTEADATLIREAVRDGLILKDGAEGPGMSDADKAAFIEDMFTFKFDLVGRPTGEGEEAEDITVDELVDAGAEKGKDFWLKIEADDPGFDPDFFGPSFGGPGFEPDDLGPMGVSGVFFYFDIV